MPGYLVVPDRLLDYLSTSVAELTTMMAEVTGLTAVRYSVAQGQIRRCDFLLAMGFPSRAFDGELLQQIRFRKLVLWLDDLGWDDEVRREEIAWAVNRSDLIITPNPTKFRLLWPQYAHKMQWLALHASQEFLQLPFQERPLRKCLLSGNTGPKYPVRHLAFLKTQQEHIPLDVLPHPGYSPFAGWIREAYAEILNRYFCCLTDGHRTWLDFAGCPDQQDYFRRSGFEEQARSTGQVVKKYFEIPATGSLLIADNPSTEEMKALVSSDNYFSRLATIRSTGMWRNC